MHFKLKGLAKVLLGYNFATGNFIYLSTRYNIPTTERKSIKVDYKRSKILLLN